MGHLSGVCRFVYSVRLSIVELMSYAFVHNLRSYSLPTSHRGEGGRSFFPLSLTKKKKKMPDGKLRFFPLHELITCLNCAGCRTKPKRVSGNEDFCLCFNMRTIPSSWAFKTLSFNMRTILSSWAFKTLNF